ncbi:MAG TPA: hypothetical protein VF553_19965 [Pyrinomonadaceae bacterium]|jgi:hypothetical protein
MMKVNTMRAMAALCLLLVALPGVMGQRRRASSSSSSAASPDYFPLRPGDMWTYRHSEGSQFTVKVLNDEKQADGSVRYVVELLSGARVHYTYSKPRGWVLQHRHSYPDEQTGLKIDYQPAKQYLKNPLVAGEKWNWSGKDVGGNDVSESSRVVGLEWVEVPAGKFRAMKIISLVSSGASVATKTYWYVDGVGLVKAWTDAGAVKYGWELIDYSFRKGPAR